VTIFDADTLYHAVTLTCDPLTLNICSTSDSCHMIKVCTIFKQNPTVLRWVIDNLANFPPSRHVVTLNFDLLTMNTCSRSDHVIKLLCTKFGRNRSIRGQVIDHLKNFRTLFTFFKNYGREVDETSASWFPAQLRIHFLIYFSLGAAAQVGRFKTFSWHKFFGGLSWRGDREIELH